MYDENKTLLYVGKAKNLKKRISAYFSSQRLNARMNMMMMRACHLECTVTQTEAEALLLESNLIKHNKPGYNILLRDDKSYPHISIGCHHAWPRVALHRGTQRSGDRYFGPYPNAQAARYTTHLLYKLFRLRQCPDSMFNNRSRPCMQYQIKRCSAPCVDYISAEDYAHDVELAIEFLSGDSRRLIERLIATMDEATQTLEYEKAARYRDQIKTLREISEQHYVSSCKRGEVDIMACKARQGVACVQVFSVRRGLHIGNRAYYPRLPDHDVSEEEILAAFITQYYLRHPIPLEIILSHRLDNEALIAAALIKQAKHAVRLTHAVRKTRRQWLQSAIRNAEHALNGQLLSKASQAEKMQSLTRLLGLQQPPPRLECFDVSHTMGEETVASCVVFTAHGPCKEAYRLFNIRNDPGGDDYAALTQALQRHYTRIKDREEKHAKQGQGTTTVAEIQHEATELRPTVLLIDGGKGQLNAAQQALSAVGMDNIMLVSIAKGEGRKAGRETLYRFAHSSKKAKAGKRSLINNGREIEPIPVAAEERAGFYFILQIRDEAHRFAIRGHRSRRTRQQRRSPLEDIPGLGAKRRHQLLRYFGGAQGIYRANIDELSKVPGISRKLAGNIYDALHGQ